MLSNKRKRARWTALLMAGAAPVVLLSATPGYATVETGAIAASSDGDLGSPNAALTFGNAQLTLSGGINVMPGGTLTGRSFSLTDALTANLNSSVWLFTGPISGTGSLNKQGSGVLLLDAANSYSGGTTVTQSVLYALTNTALGTGAVSVSSGGTLGIYQPPYTTNASNAGSVPIGAGGAPISLANAITLAGTGSILDLGGGATVQGGALFNYQTNTTLTGPITLNGATQITNEGNLTVSGSVGGVNGGGLTAQGGYQTVTTLSGPIGSSITGGVSLVGDSHTDGALFVLSGNNAYTGGTSVSGGARLQIASDASLGNVSSGLTLNGATLELTAGVTSARGISLGTSNGLIEVDANTVSSFSGAVTGPGALTIRGAGEVDLSGASSFTGGTEIISGTLGVQSNMALGAGAVAVNGILALSGGITLANQMAWDAATIVSRQGSNVLTGPIYVGGSTINTLSGSLEISGGISGVNLNVTGAGTTILSGVIDSSVTGGIVQSELGTLILTRANAYSGGTTVIGGTLIAQQSQALGTGTVALLTGGALALESATPSSYGNLLEIAGSGVSGNGALENRSGSAQLSGNIVLLGNVRINSSDQAGALAISGNIAGVTQGNTALTFGGAGNTAVSGIILNSPTSQTAGTTGWGGSGFGVISVADGGGIARLALGTIGSVQFQLPPLPAGLAQNGASLQAMLALNANASTIESYWSPTYLATPETLVPASAAQTAAEVLAANLPANIGAGSVSLVKDGGGTLTLSGANLYSGGTTVLGGTLAVSSDNNLGATSAGVSLAGGTLELTANVSSARSITLAPGVLDGIGTDAQTVSTLTGVISGAGGLTKTGNGTLVLAGTSAYTGETTVSAGTLRAGSSMGLTINSSYAVASGATLDLNGLAQTVGSLTGSGQVTLGGGTLTVASKQAGATFSGLISGSGAVVKAGSGTSVLSGANTYTGGTTIQGGVLAVNNASLQGNVVDNATLDFVQNTNGSFAGNISGTGSLVKDGAGALTLSGTLSYTGTTTILAGELIGNTSNLPGTISGTGMVVIDQTTNGTLNRQITSTGSVDKAGAGTLVLTGQNSAAGGTLIDNGLLEVGDSGHADATMGGNVSVDSNGALGGHGAVMGDVTVLPGGMVLPGGSIGTLTVSGNYAAKAGSTLAIEVSPTAASKLVVGGSASLGGTLLLMFDPGVYTPRRFPILTAAGGVSGTFATVTTTGATPAMLGPALTYGANEVDVALATIVAPANDSIFPAMTTMLVENARRASLSLIDRLDDQHPVTASQNANALGASLSGNQLDAAIAAAALADSKRNDGTWFQGSGDFLSVNGSTDAPGFTARTAGFETRYDQRVGADGRLGVALGYDRAELSEHSGSTGNADSVRFSAYGGMAIGGNRLDATLGYAHDWLHTNRPLYTLTPASESRGADQFDAQAQLSRQIAFSAFTLRPKFGFDYQHVTEGGFAESGGSGFALSGLSTSLDRFEPFIGADAAMHFHSGDGVEWLPSVGLRYSRTVAGAARGQAVVTTSGDMFNAEGIAPSRDRLDLAAGLTVLDKTRYTVAASYLVTVPTGNLLAQDVELTLRVQF